jgi:hypothetical protein
MSTKTNKKTKVIHGLVTDSKGKSVVDTGDELIPYGHKARLLGQGSVGIVTVKGYTGEYNYVLVEDYEKNKFIVVDGVLTMKGV